MSRDFYRVEHVCQECGDVITDGTINATGCTLTPWGWTCGVCADDGSSHKRDRALVAAGVDAATGGVCGLGDAEADAMIARVDAALSDQKTWSR